jgi:hypothetical protein
VADERGEAGREKHGHHEGGEHDPAGHGEPQRGKDRISGQGQRGEGARQDQSRRTDRRPGMLECDGSGLPWFHALLGLLAKPRDHEDVVVGTQRDHEAA